VVQGCAGAQEHEQGVAALGRKMQAAQAECGQLGEPPDQRGAGVVLEHLFAGPEGVSRILGAQPEQPAIGAGPVVPALAVGHVRRGKQHDAALWR